MVTRRTRGAEKNDTQDPHRTTPRITSSSLQGEQREYKICSIEQCAPTHGAASSPPSLCAAPLEGRGVVAWVEPKTNILTVWSSTQMPHLVRRQIAAQLNLPEETVRVIAPDIGGGFGPKVFVYPEEILVSFLALQLGRPVKWIEDRREHFISTAHGREQVHDVELAFDETGRILGLRDQFLLDNGAYNPMGLTDAYNTAAHLQGPYKSLVCRSAEPASQPTRCRTLPIAAPDIPEAVFVIERCMDLIAAKLSLDPAEVRRRNFVQPEEMPYHAGILYRDGEPICYDSGNYPETLARALKAAGYEELRKQQQELRQHGRYLGVGIGCYVEGTGVGSFEGAKVRIDPSGQIVVATGATGHGQGHETIFAQIAADLWGVSPEDVRLVEGDTASIQFGCGTFGSRSTVNVGSALFEASARLKEKVLQLAAHLLEANRDDLELGNGKVFIRGMPQRSLSFSDLARAAVPGWASKLPDGLEPGPRKLFILCPPRSRGPMLPMLRSSRSIVRRGKSNYSTTSSPTMRGNLSIPCWWKGKSTAASLRGSAPRFTKRFAMIPTANC